MEVSLEQRGQAITLVETQALGSGGQARVFPVEAHPEWAAKVYHKPDFRHAAKLAVMVADPPEDPMATRGHASIAWPLDLLVDSAGTVVGFLMPRVNGTRPIIDYFNPKTRRQACPGFNYFYLLRTARNLAAAMHAIHSRGYVVGDVNDSNTLVSPTALVTLVDTDSFQVYDHGSGECYRCPVGRLEYSAPEVLARVGQGLSYASMDRASEQDLFGLAVLLFQLLMEGTHPFAGVYKGRSDAPTYSERIVAGHFAYYQGQDVPYQPAPLAPPFELLHPLLQQAFLECFVEGQRQPGARYAALAWVRLLDQVSGEVIYCKANAQHVYWPHLKNCPWCARAARLGGRDPFPALASAPPPSAVEAPVASGAVARPSPSSAPHPATPLAQQQPQTRLLREAHPQKKQARVRVILPTWAEHSSPAEPMTGRTAEAGLETSTKAWLVTAALVLSAILGFPYWHSAAIQGRVLPGQYDAWKEVEILAIKNADLKQIVGGYNDEISDKIDDYARRWKYASSSNDRQAAEQGWRQVQTSALWDRIYGSGGASAAPKTKAGPFLITRGDSRGRFNLTLPRGGSWCFFVTGTSEHYDCCCYFKQATFLLNRRLVIDSLDRVSSVDSPSKTAGEGPSVKELIGAKTDFFLTFLKQHYGLAALSLDSKGGFRNASARRMASEEALGRGGARSNIGATVLWLLVGLGYVTYARVQKNLVVLLGGLAIFFLAVSGILAWVWTSLCCLIVMIVVFVLAREGY